MIDHNDLNAVLFLARQGLADLSVKGGVDMVSAWSVFTRVAEYQAGLAKAAQEEKPPARAEPAA